MRGQARAEDFKRWELAAKRMSIAALRFSYEDALAAFRSVSTFNEDRGSFYKDEALTYFAELKQRGAV